MFHTCSVLMKNPECQLLSVTVSYTSSLESHLLRLDEEAGEEDLRSLLSVTVCYWGTCVPHLLRLDEEAGEEDLRHEDDGRRQLRHLRAGGEAADEERGRGGGESREPVDEDLCPVTDSNRQ